MADQIRISGSCHQFVRHVNMADQSKWVMSPVGETRG